ncbi:gamma-glutamylcyclotransferase [Variovorax sp. ZS18.2.2]|uniref:gamma-glutamylcyclotransferase family protein n=1 Tax=Variovorax sp. ZS18.2.2 TaxID=2971255 RepID=UPI002150B917|nr:gamma-glutamylcyclotransferase family protein [Variovorax sp. ZS18.2.2]MCR6477137.1 gamma-glutamylcyclotransferase [Variovorax sp. ZS18.2.2]
MMPHVFVYGTLRRLGRNDIARYRPAPVFVEEASIAGTLYDLGAYPGIALGGVGRVKGEIYRVEPAVEAALDLLEEVAEDDSGEYIKREVRVAVGAQWLDCLVYEIHPSRIAGRPVISGGDWIAHAAQKSLTFSPPRD